MIKLLKSRFGMSEEPSVELIEAIHFGKVISLNFEDAREAEDFAEKLTELDVKVEIEA